MDIAEKPIQQIPLLQLQIVIGELEEQAFEQFWRECHNFIKSPIHGGIGHHHHIVPLFQHGTNVLRHLRRQEGFASTTEVNHAHTSQSRLGKTLPESLHTILELRQFLVEKTMVGDVAIVAPECTGRHWHPYVYKSL